MMGCDVVDQLDLLNGRTQLYLTRWSAIYKFKYEMLIFKNTYCEKIVKYTLKRWLKK